MIVVAKLLGSLLYPLSVALLSLLAAFCLLRRRPGAARGLAAFGIVWLWLWSTPWLSELAAGCLERDYPAQLADAYPSADAIVLLGGLLLPAQPPARPHPDLNAAADRAWFAARLWHAGKAPVLVCSGGRAPLSQADAPECPEVAVFLNELGVPENAVLVEATSRTTAENAAAVAALLPAGARILLVTSASHMRRAERVFVGHGFDVVPAATDHAERRPRPFNIRDLAPSARALGTSTTVWHEWLGLAWYRLNQATP